MKDKKESNAKKRGGQPGNQNARTHGFYSYALTPEQQETLGRAAKLRNLDAEIAVLRLKILSILTNDPDNHSAMLRAASMLTRMLKSNAAFKAGPQPQEPYVLQFVVEKGLPEIRTTSTSGKGQPDGAHTAAQADDARPEVKKSGGEGLGVQEPARPPVGRQYRCRADTESNVWQY